MSTVDFRTAQSNRQNPEEAAEELAAGLSFSPKVVALFADAHYDQQALNAALRARLPRGTKLVGGSTMAPIAHDGFRPGQVVAAGIAGAIEVGVGLAKDLGADPAGAGARALTQACQQLGVKPADLDPRRHVALVIDDGYRFRKEEFLVGMLDVNPSITLVGGGASHFQFPPEGAPSVHVDGEVAGDAVAVALFRIDAPWAALRHHAYVPTGDRVVITKIDDSARRALEIDGKPAAARYAELSGVAVDELESKHAMWNLSTAMKVGREYFMRAPWRPLPDGSVLFANLLTENMELELMKLGDMPQMLDRFMRDEVPTRVPSTQGMLLFDCAGRGEIIHAHGTAQKIGEALSHGPRGAGLSACFELCNGFQINCTMTALAFGGSHG